MAQCKCNENGNLPKSRWLRSVLAHWWEKEWKMVSLCTLLYKIGQKDEKWC